MHRRESGEWEAGSGEWRVVSGQPPPALPCGSFEEKHPVVIKDEPRMNTNRHEDTGTLFNDKRHQVASATLFPWYDFVSFADNTSRSLVTPPINKSRRLLNLAAGPLPGMATKGTKTQKGPSDRQDTKSRNSFCAFCGECRSLQHITFAASISFPIANFAKGS